MRDIQRKYYTEAMRQLAAEDTPEKREAFRREIYENGKRKKGQKANPIPPKVLNPDSLKWFESLQDPVIAFAQSLQLDLQMRVENETRGFICFETSFFELDERDGAWLLAFWSTLCESADCIHITHCNDKFRIEIWVDLYIIPEEK